MNNKVYKVAIWTDGSCTPNPGKMGYAALLEYKGAQRLVTGNSGNIEGTNNKAELMAAIVGLQALKEPCEVSIFTDSQYLANLGSRRWQPKTNHDVYRQLLAAEHTHVVTYVWLREFSTPQQTVVHEAAEKESK
jgi:ribonuclease HI